MALREPVRYCDAIRLLGADDADVVDLIDRLVADEATDLLAARTDLVGFAHQALNRLDREAHLLSRVERTRHIAAAHSVVVVTAFFESLDDTELPFRLDNGLDDAAAGVADRKRLGEFVALLVASAPPLPRPQRSASDGRTRVRRFYLRRCKQLPSVLRGMPLWEDLDQSQRDAVIDRLGSALADRCVRRYEELRDKLAASFPEFGAWAALSVMRPRYASAPETPMGLSRLQHRLQSISTGRVPSAVRGALARSHQERLALPSGTQTGGTHVPPLSISYVNPDFRVAEITAQTRPHDPDWWHEHTGVRDDLAEFLLGHLTSPRALTHPLVVLGAAGSGKSALASVLAARLPESDFTAVRVSGRNLPADADAQALADRFDHALAASGGGNCDALPVLVLDGIEDLDTRSRASRSALLAGLERFQRERADGPDPVAIVLTCRDSTAARLRFPVGSVAVRLEEFTNTQIATWLSIWNRVNAGYFHHHGVASLDWESLEAHLPLARRPLPLLMMAVYDGVGNALRRLSAPLRETALYERWLRMLTDAADRADPAGTGRPAEAESDPAVRSGRIEQALLTASLLALSLFHRGGQVVDGATVAADRDELVRWPPNYARPLDPLRLACVRSTDALEGAPPSLAFTDPVLGDYLVARLIAEELAELAEARIRELRSIRPAPLDDSFLYALLSFTPLSVSGEVPRFLTERLRLLSAHVRDELRLALADLLREAGRHRREAHYGGYRPVDLGAAARDAAYTANLMLVLVAVHGGAVPLRELFGADAAARWRSLAHLWRSQLSPEQWTSLTDTLRVDDDGSGDLVVHPCDGAPPTDDPGAQTDLGEVARDAALLADGGTQRLLHALSPLVRLFGGDVTARDGGDVSDAHAVLALAFGSSETDDAELVACYERAFAMADALGSEERLRFIVFLLRQLRGHAHRLGARLAPLAARHVRPIGVARSARAAVRRLAEEHNEHVAAVRDVLAGRW
ncbi:ATP-binding protein [Thermobifida halotolerans]|uniref:ATP-binding protein n=1 Tax=Thermobifida halotolerans TaxID=483545 RepID=UPI001F3E3983|nr:ATP-binding protein [Thermobifida halotolerans]